MKTSVNTKLFILNDLLNKSYSEILQLIDTYLCADIRLETQKRLLMYDFEDNDVEAQQLIDTIELQQYYIGKNLDILEQAMETKEKSFFMNIPYSGILIGLN
jgi:hypothetical protein